MVMLDARVILAVVFLATATFWAPLLWRTIVEIRETIGAAMVGTICDFFQGTSDQEEQDS